jgi:hypothetical protein
MDDGLTRSPGEAVPPLEDHSMALDLSMRIDRGNCAYNLARDIGAVTIL